MRKRRAKHHTTLDALVAWLGEPDDRPVTQKARAWLWGVARSAPIAAFDVSETRRGVLVKLSDDEIRALRVELRDFLRSVVRTTAWRDDYDSAEFVIPTLEVRALTFGALSDASRAVLMVDGSPRDLLVFAVVQLLHTSSIRRVLLCECGRLFLKVGRREFCSRRCQNRVYMQRLRQRERHDARRRQRASRQRRG